jgi:beta-catenin-like protein 1
LKKSYKSFSEVEEEEHVIGILASLFRNLPLDSGHRLRVVHKFVEDDFAKLERLLDIREGYDARVKTVNESIREEQRSLGLTEEEIEEEEPERSLQRLDAGLFVLQLVDLILAYLCAEDFDLGEESEEAKKIVEAKSSASSSSSSSLLQKESIIKSRLITLMNRRGQSINEIKSNIEEYLNGLETDLAISEKEGIGSLPKEKKEIEDGELIAGEPVTEEQLKTLETRETVATVKQLLLAL